ncbi:MAG: hypothetical protein KF774_00975 [Planctomyces sp.]|nr:hypothetical protein [Planctomyces sp.]
MRLIVQRLWRSSGPRESAIGAAMTAAAAGMYAVTQPASPYAHSPARTIAVRGAAPTADIAPEPATAMEPDEGLTDRRLRKVVIGRWRTYYHGEWLIENRPDGSATMNLTFDFLAALRYGPKMSVQLNWVIEDGQMTYVMTSGDPSDKFQRMIDDYGDRATWKFQTFSSDEMKLLKVAEYEESYVWKRIVEGGASDSSAAME